MSGIESAGYFKARSDPARVSKRVVLQNTLQNWSLVKVFFNDLAVSPVPRRNTVLRKGRNIPSRHIFVTDFISQKCPTPLTVDHLNFS